RGVRWRQIRRAAIEDSSLMRGVTSLKEADKGAMRAVTSLKAADKGAMRAVTSSTNAHHPSPNLLCVTQSPRHAGCRALAVDGIVGLAIGATGWTSRHGLARRRGGTAHHPEVI